MAAARYSRRSAVITRTGQDPFGEYLHDALRGFGVDDRYVTAVPGLPTLGWKTPRQALARSLRLPLEGTGQADKILAKDGIEAGSDRDAPIDCRPAQGGLS